MLTEHTWTAALHGIYAGTYNSWRTKSDIVKCLQIAFSQNKAVLLVGPPPKNTPRLCSRTTCTGKPGLTQIKSNSFSRQLIAEGSNQLLIKTRQTKIELSSWEPQHFSKLLMHPQHRISLNLWASLSKQLRDLRVQIWLEALWKMSTHINVPKKRNWDRHQLTIYSGLKWTR